MTFSPANRTTAPLEHANCGAMEVGLRVAGRNLKGGDLFDQAHYLRPLVERAAPVSNRLVMVKLNSTEKGPVEDQGF